ncbi:BTAD domain-containing putative transcriptional regulator [Streptomyces sp. NPDC048291]|uniref:AfsR/SARP family transcriptional regulator n=1 Tax=Streptomyces sp. NPDC048291 TaxID=3365530 RepID=UPI00371A42F4
MLIEINLLGSFRIRRDELDVTPSAPKLRQVLALLVLNVNTLVTADQLCEELWGEYPPVSALTTLQTYIYQLRRKLRLSTGQSGAAFGSRPSRELPALLTRVGGYELRLRNKDAVDAYRFERVAEQGMTEYREGAAETAVRTLREALAIWRGEALVDVSGGHRLSAWSTQLEERRKSTLEKRFAIALELGHHQAVVDELSAVVRAYPTHEIFAGQLMRVLQRCGRRPDALDVFRVLRSRLVHELGLEPSAPLQKLHQEVLADRGHPVRQERLKSVPAAAVRPAAPRPAQLPADLSDFVGREAELDQVEAYLCGDASPEVGLRLVEVHGPPGVGKTAFATRAAHRLRRHFSDGQLFIDLTHVDNGAAQLADVLAASLSACGMAREKLPTGLDELGQLFRTVTADRRVLLVIDDVLAASQLRALLPGGSSCSVITTNRYRTQGLATGRKIALSALSPGDSLQLFDGLVGGGRQGDEAVAVGELMRMCDGLPLAVRGVGTRLAARPTWSAARLMARLRRDRGLLLELQAGTQSLLSTVESSYRLLSERHRLLLYLMAENGRMRWRLDEVGRLLPGDDVETLVESLVDVHLVNESLGLERRSGPPGENEPVYTLSSLNRQAVLRLYPERGRPGLVSLTKARGVVRPRRSTVRSQPSS